MYVAIYLPLIRTFTSVAKGKYLSPEVFWDIVTAKDC